MIQIFVAHWDPHLDAPNKRRGQHWSRPAKRRKLAADYMAVAISNLARRVGAPQVGAWLPGKVAVEFHVRMKPRQRALDRDNATASIKPLLDALVALRVIEDDRPSIIPDPVHVHETPASHHKATPGVLITIRARDQ